jgi:TatD DNase family protein
MKIIDTHTHLYLEQFVDDIDTVISNARVAGINKFIFPSIHSKYNDLMINCYNKFKEHCFLMAGLHPAYVTENNDSEILLVHKNLEKYNCVAVGEIGIDLHWEKKFLKQQRIVFEKQINMALDYNLPIVIHCRNAFDEIYKILLKYNTKNLSGVFHCFSGDFDQALKVCDLNFKLGIGGVVTFKNGGLDKFLNKIPIENIVLETDSPYLAPSPFRGKRNESSYIIYVIDKLSEIYQLDNDSIANTTTKNAIDIFNLDK